MNFIHEAGWVFYPVLLFGFIAIGLAARYAITMRKELFALIVAFGVATLIMGLLGTIIGVQRSAQYIGDVDDAHRWIFLLGLRESLNNLVGACVLAMITTLTTGLGGFRIARARSRQTSAAST